MNLGIRDFNNLRLLTTYNVLKLFLDIEQLLIFSETLRKYPAIPTIIKQCRENYKVDEFDLELPKGAFIFYSIMGVHRDPVNYPQPDKFDPDRFFEKCELESYIPFGFDILQTIGKHKSFYQTPLNVVNISFER